MSGWVRFLGCGHEAWLSGGPRELDDKCPPCGLLEPIGQMPREVEAKWRAPTEYEILSYVHRSDDYPEPRNWIELAPLQGKPRRPGAGRKASKAQQKRFKKWATPKPKKPKRPKKKKPRKKYDRRIWDPVVKLAWRAKPKKRKNKPKRWMG